MRTVGRHILIDLWNCDREVLEDRAAVEAILHEAAKAAGATVVAVTLHQFDPSGVTGAVVLAESHMCLHTWPEQGYAAVDVYTCGDCDPDAACKVIEARFSAERVQVIRLTRGVDESFESIALAG